MVRYNQKIIIAILFLCYILFLFYRQIAVKYYSKPRHLGIVVSDSLQIDKNKTLYAFFYRDFGGGGEMTYFMITNNMCHLTRDSAIAYDSTVRGIYGIQNDTITILSSTLEFVNPSSIYKFNNIRILDGNFWDYRRKRNFKNVYLNAICK